MMTIILAEEAEICCSFWFKHLQNMCVLSQIFSLSSLAFHKDLSGIAPEYRTVLTQISVLIWVQNVCKGYQQAPKSVVTMPINLSTHLMVCSIYIEGPFWHGIAHLNSIKRQTYYLSRYPAKSPA